MLVRVDNAAGLTGAERELAEWLRVWPGSFWLPGTAVVAYDGGSNPGATRVGAVIWAPQSCVVVEVSGFTSTQDGELHVPPHGPWTIEGHQAALDHPDPLEALRAGLAEVTDRFGASNLDAGYVRGTVLIFPPNDAAVWLEPKPHIPEGVEIIMCNGVEDLRAYFYRLTAEPKAWTADRVLEAYAALGLSSAAPRRAELVTEGFPELASEAAVARARSDHARSDHSTSPIASLLHKHEAAQPDSAPRHAAPTDPEWIGQLERLRSVGRLKVRDRATLAGLAWIGAAVAILLAMVFVDVPGGALDVRPLLLVGCLAAGGFMFYGRQLVDKPLEPGEPVPYLSTQQWYEAAATVTSPRVFRKLWANPPTTAPGQADDATAVLD